MTRFLNILFVFGVVAFWIVMNGQLVMRELDVRGQEGYQRGVREYLGAQLRRERWMGIYRKNRKIGYTGLIVEKIFSDDGDQHKMSLETELTVDLFGKGQLIRLDGEVYTDLQMLPETLVLDVQIEDGHFHLTGRRDEDRFVIRVSSGKLKLFELPLPLRELSLTNGLTIDLPVSGLEVGQSFTLSVFNPILFQDAGQATITVEEKTRRRLTSGLRVDCFRLTTKFQGQSSDSWVTADGEVIRQEVPHLGIILVQEPKETAQFPRRAKPSRD